MAIQRMNYKELISNCLLNLKNNNQEVAWSDFVVAFKKEIVESHNDKGSDRSFKQGWVTRTKSTAQEMGIKINMARDNWYIVTNEINSNNQISHNVISSSDITPSTKSPSSAASTSTSNSSTSSSKSKLGVMLTNADKEKVLKMYSEMDENRMWRLSSGKYVEKKMKELVEKLNYQHPACSVVLDINDSNWEDAFTEDEINEIKEATVKTNASFPQDLQAFIDGIPNTTDLKTIFDHLNRQIIDPLIDPALYWLKNALLQSAYMLLAKRIPIKAESEREIISRAWGFIETAFDFSDLEYRSERTSTSSSTERNKKRKLSSTDKMTRRTSGYIPDMVIAYDRYEFGAAEVGKTENDSTKQLNDRSKLAHIMKSMLLNLSNHCQLDQIVIEGMIISGLTINFSSLANAGGYVCVVSENEELYYPSHPKEFKKKMIPLVKKIWMMKLTMEARLEIILTGEQNDNQFPLPPCF